ncbi:hypothetical protein PR003_g4611 [Phytophthora rubi]|uniref:Uncharacterized protein n=2 Tax=Phytophthora TaxID=4783 RepID=A0A6A4G661_9STRA|nr:hypothetical protein PR003_g4611 [Phytophthora rubi]
MELEQSVSAEALLLAEWCVLGALHLLYELRAARVGEALRPCGAHSFCAAEPCAVRGAEARAGRSLYSVQFVSVGPLVPVTLMQSVLVGMLATVVQFVFVAPVWSVLLTPLVWVEQFVFVAPDQSALLTQFVGVGRSSS